MRDYSEIVDIASDLHQAMSDHPPSNDKPGRPCTGCGKKFGRGRAYFLTEDESTTAVGKFYSFVCDKPVAEGDALCFKCTTALVEQLPLALADLKACSPGLIFLLLYFWLYVGFR